MLKDVNTYNGAATCAHDNAKHYMWISASRSNVNLTFYNMMEFGILKSVNLNGNERIIRFDFVGKIIPKRSAERHGVTPLFVFAQGYVCHLSISFVTNIAVILYVRRSVDHSFNRTTVQTMRNDVSDAL
jgi:hypothetical protein